MKSARNRPWFVLRSVPAGLALCAFFCTHPAAPTGDRSIDPPQGTFAEASYNYYLGADTIYVIQAKCDCIDTTPIFYHKTTPYAFSLDEPALSVSIPVFSDSSVVIGTITQRFSRLSGKGLVGNWLLDSITYQLSDTAGADSEAVLKSFSAEESMHYSWMAITSNTILLFSNPENTFTTTHLKEWTLAITAQNLSIKIDSLSPSGVLLYGPLTGDSVYIFDSLFTKRRTYRINDTTFTPNPYIYKTDGTMCSSEEFPTWFDSFIKRN